jgi:TnpA family transposase
MPVDFLSDEQVARYGRFAAEPSPGELEMFFRLDERALTHARSKRAPSNRLGWAVQWGAVRMLGAFVTEDLSAVPEVVVRFAAEQVDVDPAEFGAYAERRQSRYEHAWEIRDAFGYTKFESAEEQVRAFVGARVWASQEGPRALFDRAVVWLVEHRVLLPGITTLTRLVAEVRRAENARLYGLLPERTPAETAEALRGLLQVPEDRRVSELERLRTSPVKASGRVLVRVDFPELLLEVFDRTGLASDFTHISGADSPMEDFAVSLCGLIVAEACNVGLVPIEKPNVPVLTRARLQQVDQGYVRAETISAANARMIAAQAGINIVNCWGGGQIASADGLRFVVPVANLHTGHNPIYFGRQRGATWLNVVNDQVMGIGGLVVPGTLRDSLFILDAIHTIDGGPRPEMVVTDTASYSDIVFGLFAICGYQFSPRIADLGDTRLWRTNTRATYGPLDHMSRHTVRLDRIRAHWDDMLRVAGSLTTGKVRAYDLIRMLSRDGRLTGLGDAFAHYGRIFKTLHLLQFISADGYRRMIGTQLNTQEGRHRLARRIAFGNRGQLRQRYREGMEDQLGALGLALNAVVWWNTLYLDAAVKQIRKGGFPATDDMCARLSPIAYEHINILGRYAFTRAEVAAGLRPFHDPAHEGDASPGAMSASTS